MLRGWLSCPIFRALCGRKKGYTTTFRNVDSSSNAVAFDRSSVFFCHEVGERSCTVWANRDGRANRSSLIVTSSPVEVSSFGWGTSPVLQPSHAWCCTSGVKSCIARSLFVPLTSRYAFYQSPDKVLPTGHNYSQHLRMTGREI